MADTSPATQSLRNQIDSSEIAVMPGVYDALSAMLAEQAGFEAVLTSGFSISATKLGKPDIGLLTMSENIERIRSITNAISTPLVADMDTGYGNALNVRRSVNEAIDAGVAGIILEDQQWPKRCGHMREKSVVPATEHAQRIQAAADVRAESDTDIIIIGRTDAREPHDLDEALRRGHMYANAGADVIFVEAPQSRDELETIATEFDQPTFANMIEGGKTPYLPYNELASIGFDIVVYPLSALFAVTQTLADTFEQLQTTGTTTDRAAVEFDRFDEIINANMYREQEKRYGSLDEESFTDSQET